MVIQKLIIRINNGGNSPYRDKSGIRKKLCVSLGHDWDTSERYDQPCKRCTAHRVKIVNEYKLAKGEKSMEWMIME